MIQIAYNNNFNIIFLLNLNTFCPFTLTATLSKFCTFEKKNYTSILYALYFKSTFFFINSLYTFIASGKLI